MTTTVKIDMKDADTIIKEHGFAPGGKIQMMLTNEIMRISDPYVPLQSAMLKNMTVVAHDGTYYEHTSPYSRYHWYGKLMVDPITKKGAFFKPGYGYWSRPNVQKELTNRKMKYQGAPLRGPKWTMRAWADNKQQVLEKIERIANR